MHIAYVHDASGYTIRTERCYRAQWQMLNTLWRVYLENLEPEILTNRSSGMDATVMATNHDELFN
jgi:hypothetical protein